MNFTDQEKPFQTVWEPHTISIANAADDEGKKNNSLYPK